jgi:hypothetical protein
MFLKVMECSILFVLLVACPVDFGVPDFQIDPEVQTQKSMLISVSVTPAR